MPYRGGSYEDDDEKHDGRVMRYRSEELIGCAELSTCHFAHYALIYATQLPPPKGIPYQNLGIHQCRRRRVKDCSRMLDCTESTVLV
jgi:hypothetical protein